MAKYEETVIDGVVLGKITGEYSNFTVTLENEDGHTRRMVVENDLPDFPERDVADQSAHHWRLPFRERESRAS